MKIYCKLHSAESEQHDHSQEAVECELVSGSLGDYQIEVRTPAGVRCRAINNPWTGWMADDIYGVVQEGGRA